MASNNNNIGLIPPDKIGETHSWREWFKNVALLLQSARIKPSTITFSTDTAWMNGNPYTIDVFFSGGTVTQSAWSRDNVTWYVTGILTGFIPLSPGDYIKITYTSAPIITQVPRACG